MHTYIGGYKLVMRRLRLPNKEGELSVTRWLGNDKGDKKTLVVNMTYTPIDSAGNHKTPVPSMVYFEYQGKSPNMPPPSRITASSSSASNGDESSKSKLSSSALDTATTKTATTTSINSANNEAEDNQKNIEKKDFSGVWSRTKQHDMESVLAATGAGYMQKKLGASMPLTHTIAMDTPNLQAFRLTERGGPLNLDTKDCK